MAEKPTYEKSERRREALRANEEKYRHLFESSRDAIMILEPPSWDFTSGNPAAVKMFGAKNENEFVSYGPGALSPERQPDGRASAEKAQEMIETAVREGSHFFEWTHRRIGGKDFPAEVLLTRMEQAGKLLLQATVRDITERKRAEFERESTVRILEILNAETVFRKLMHSLLHFMQEITGCQALGIRLRKGNDFPYYEVSGFSDNFVASETHLCVEDLNGQLERDDIGNPVLECMCGNVIRGRFDSSKPFFTEFGSFVTNSTTRLLADTSEQDRQTRTRNRCNGEGYESVLLIPLRTGEKTFGLLQFNDRQEGRFPQQIVNHLERIAGNVALALAQRESEKALKESEERFNLAMDASRDGVYEWDLETREIYYSPGWKRMLGYKPDELPDDFSVWEKLTRPEDVEKSWQIMKELVEGKRERFEVEFEMRHKDGHWVHILSRSNLYKDAKGKPVRVVGTHVDISESKHQEKSLKLSESRYKKAQELGKVGNWEYDLKAEECWGSDEAKKLFELDPDKDSFSIEEVESCIIERERVHQALVDLIENGKPYNLEYDIITKNTGKIKTFVSIAEIEKDWAKNPVKISGVIHDITERKQAAAKLAENEDKYHSLFNQSTEGIYLHDLEGRILDVNEKACEQSGYSRQEWLDLTVFDGHSTQSRMNLPKTEILQTWSKLVQGHRATFEAEHQRKDGTVYPVEISTGIVRYGDSNAVLAIVRDITERKQAEAEREKLQAQLIQAQKMESVGRLAGGIAHDYNNMLGVIIGCTEISLDNLTPDDPMRENLEEVLKAGRRSADITRQLLAFARKQTIAPKVLELNETVEQMLKMLRRFIGEDINLFWQPGAGRMTVFMDPSQVDQILANLCVNARDAIADVGKVTIETGTVTFDSAYCAEHPGFVTGDFVLLAVSDDGCGMDQEMMANLFEPFFTTKDVGKGTGLGLATVYGIVKQNDGFINVYSEQDQGTTFRIYLPRHLAETDRMEKKTSDKINLDVTETILLVEDEPSILKMTRKMLERMGYKVFATGTPGEAIALAREHAGEIHLLMTDVVMPEMNGRALAKTLLSLYPNLKRLFMSGYTANVIADHGVLDEGVQFIQKPFAKQDLAIKVREVLDEAK